MPAVPQPDSLHILVVDDHAIVRDGVAQLVQGVRPGCQVSLASRLDEAETLIEACPDCGLVILDVHLPGLAHPLEGFRRLRARRPLLAMLLVSGDEDAQLARMALHEGAAGFVLKSSDTSVLANALRLVLDGGCYVPPNLVRAGALSTGPLETMTPRQRDVLRQLINGKSNKEIGRSLGMSEPTVKAHLVNIFRTLGARNRSQAVLAGSRLLG